MTPLLGAPYGILVQAGEAVGEAVSLFDLAAHVRIRAIQEMRQWMVGEAVDVHEVDGVFALLDDSFAVLGPDLRAEFGLGYLYSAGDRVGVRDVDVATLVAHLEHEARVVLGVLGLLYMFNLCHCISLLGCASEVDHGRRVEGSRFSVAGLAVVFVFSAEHEIQPWQILDPKFGLEPIDGVAEIHLERQHHDVDRATWPSSVLQSLIPFGSKPTFMPSSPRHTAAQRQLPLTHGSQGTPSSRNPCVEVRQRRGLDVVPRAVAFAKRLGALALRLRRVAERLQRLGEALDNVGRKLRQALRRVLIECIADPGVGPPGVRVNRRRNDSLTSMRQNLDGVLAVDRKLRILDASAAIERREALAADLLDRAGRHNALDCGDDLMVGRVDVDGDDVIKSERYANSSIWPLGPDLGLNVGRQAIAEARPIGFVEPFAAVGPRNFRARPAGDGSRSLVD